LRIGGAATRFKLAREKQLALEEMAMKRMLAVVVVLALCAATSPLLAGAAPGAQKGKAKRESRLKTKFGQLDTNKDGNISREEFKGKQKAFGRMDANGDGKVSFDEYKAARENAGKSGKRGKGRKGQ
jgi:hypothetical protein